MGRGKDMANIIEAEKRRTGSEDKEEGEKADGDAEEASGDVVTV